MTTELTTVLPVYLVRGDDATLRSDAARALIHQLVGDGDLTLVVEEYEPSGDDADTSAIADAAQTPPFLTDRRVVVVRDVGAFSSEALNPLLTYLDDPLDTTALVLVAGEKKPGTKLVNAVKKAGHVLDAGPPSQRGGRSTWFAEQLRGAPVNLEPAAAQRLDAHLGDDLGRLANLLAAVTAAYGDGARVTVDDLEPFLGEAGDVPPWDLTDAIDAGRTGDAISAMQRMMGAGERHPLQLLGSLHGHYARMLRLDGAGIADEATAAQALGMKGSTYPAKKALTQARKLGHEGVAEAIRLLAEADLDLRGFERVWPETLVMELLVARLSRLGPRSRR